MQYFIAWLLEIILIIIHFPSGLIGFAVPMDSVNKSAVHKTPVILVERWFRRNVLHFFLKKYLENRGYLVYSSNCSLLQGTFDESAQKLKDFIEERKLENVILVGISAGGVTCYDYLQYYNGWQKTVKFIAIASPLYGTPVARAIYFIKSGREMLPNSTFIKLLLANPPLHPNRIYCIGAKYDEMVPSKYGQLAGTTIHVLPMAGHNLLHTIWRPTFALVKKICDS